MLEGTAYNLGGGEGIGCPMLVNQWSVRFQQTAQRTESIAQ
jgi:hypothetical protein